MASRRQPATPTADTTWSGLEYNPGMHLTLIQPPALMAVDSYSAITQPPLGIAYLAAYARERGHEVHIVDAVGDAVTRVRPWPHRAKRLLQGLDVAETVARVPRDTQVIGVSCMFTHSWPMVRGLIEAIREAFPAAWLVAGGEHVTALPEQVLTQTSVDACVLGEGEHTLADLLEALAGDETDLATVPGIAYRRNDGSIAVTAPRQRIRDVDRLPLPAWDLVDPMAYQAGEVFMGPKAGRSVPMLATRGCPFRCAFCASPRMWTQLWRPRSPVLIVDEIQTYMSRWGADDFQFQDLTMIVRRDWIVALCREIISRKLDIRWSLPVGTRAEAVDREVADLLLASGCRHVTFAPESASPRILAAVEKRASIDRIERTVSSCLEAGLQVCLFMIVGFPDEQAADTRATLRWLRRMAWRGTHEIAVSTFVPLPGTRMYDDLQRTSPFEVDDEFCHWMTGATSLLTVRSWNPRLGARRLLLLKLWAMVSFYGIAYLRRPRRLVRLAVNAVTGRQETKVDRVVREFLVKARSLLPGRRDG